MPTFHVICVKVSQEGSMRCHFLPTFHGIVGKLSHVIHRMHHLPRYLRRIEPGGRSGVSSPCLPPLKKVASVPRAAPFPVIPLSSSPLRRPRPRPERAASSFRRKKSQKKSPEKFGGSGKSSTFAIPFGKRGTREAPGREEKRRRSGSGRTSEVH